MFKKKRIKSSINSHFDAPVVEVFGSALALLIIILILTNVIVTKDIKAMLDRSTENAKHNVIYQDGSEGFVVITYVDKLKIIQTNQTINKDDICLANSPFLTYAKNIYQNKKKQLIFAITEKSVSTMAIARECLRKLFANQRISIAWIIANQDLLSTVSLKELPARIKKVIQKQ